MRKLLLLFFLLYLTGQQLSAQDRGAALRFSDDFERAYKQNPSIPRGILEAVAYTNTGINHITHERGDPESCIGLPKTYGVMGLMEDGQNVFRNNLLTIAKLSGYPVEAIKKDPATNILAYAKAYSSLKNHEFKAREIEQQEPILIALSELPGKTLDNYELNYQMYSIYQFLNKAGNQQLFHFPAYKINLNTLFKQDMLKLLQSQYLSITPRAPSGEGSDFAAAVWTPAPSCNYTAGRTVTVTAIVIHDVEGSYQDCISWFKSCPCPSGSCGSCPAGSRGCQNGQPIGPTSAHYVVSNLGQVTQMVHEADKAYHVGSENGYTIGIEHEGWCRTSYPQALYMASAKLVQDICRRKNIDIKTAFQGTGCPCNQTAPCVKDQRYRIKGHQMYPNQTHTDPGPNWDWTLYYKLLTTS